MLKFSVDVKQPGRLILSKKRQTTMTLINKNVIKTVLKIKFYLFKYMTVVSYNISLKNSPVDIVRRCK